MRIDHVSAFLVFAGSTSLLVACGGSGSGGGGSGAVDGGGVGGSVSTGGTAQGGTTSTGGSGGGGGAGGSGASGGVAGGGGLSGSGGVDAGPIICATEQQCLDALGGDACKSNITCDSATAVCKYEVLDKDQDGQPPVVCGGDDCDDGVATTFKGATETCNGADDDCDGTPDDGLNCPTCNPGGLYVLLDQSGSMLDTQPAPSRWSVMKGAFTTFVSATESNVLSVALQYFPDQTGNECSPATYATPALAMTALPTGVTSITTSMASKNPTGGSVLTPAIEGAVTFMQTWAAANSTKKAGIVVITDGVGLACTTTDTPAMAAAAAAKGWSGTPKVPTYVVSLGTNTDQTSWDAVAAAGGTGTAYNTTTTGETAIVQALVSIRKALTTCP